MDAADADAPGPATEAGQGASTPMTAVALDGRIAAQDVEPALGWPRVRTAAESLVLRVDEGLCLHLFNFGALVLDGADEVPRAVRERVEGATRRRLLPMTEETWTRRVAPGVARERPRASWTGFDLAEPDDGAVDVAALLFAQSAALERYEEAVEALLDETLALCGRLAEPRLLVWRRLPAARIARLAQKRLELARWFFIVDRPEKTWDDPMVARLHDALFDQLELRERYQALLHKLRGMESTLEVLIGLAQGRSTQVLELAIVLLIVLEIVLLW